MERLNPRHGGIVSGLLFAGFVVFVVMFVAGTIAFKTVRVRSLDGPNGADVAIETPAGRLNIRARDHMSTALAGIPVYPGSYRVKESGGANIEWSSNDGRSDKNIYLVDGDFRTKDSARKVVEYYRSQLPSLMIISENDRSTQLEYKHGGIQRIISIDEKDGETRIGVASIGGRESN